MQIFTLHPAASDPPLGGRIKTPSLGVTGRVTLGGLNSRRFSELGQARLLSLPHKPLTGEQDGPTQTDTDTDTHMPHRHGQIDKWIQNRELKKDPCKTYGNLIMSKLA